MMISHRYLILSLIFAGLLAGGANGGVVHTLDGKTFEGRVSFDPQTMVLVSPKNGPDAHIDPATILDAVFVDHPSSVALHCGILMIDGSIIAADEIRKADDSTLEFRSQAADIKVPLSKVARVIFRPVPPSQWAKAVSGHFGALLDAGDLFEGEFKGIDGATVSVESVLFCISQFNTNTQILALCLADPQPASGNWVVQLANGSVITTPSLKIQNGRLLLQDEAGRSLAVEAKEIAQLRLGGARADSLADMKPAKIDPMAPESYLLDATPAGVSIALRNCTISRGICIGAGASVSYALEGKYRTFSARAGVPAAMTPLAQVRFVVLADGKEVYRSGEQTSVADATAVVVSVNGVKMLTLRVEGAQGGDLGAIGVWGDPSLIRPTP
jgi:hypothetical protein